MGKVKICAVKAVVSASSLCERAVLVLLLIFSASTFAASDQDSRLLVHIDLEILEKCVMVVRKCSDQFLKNLIW